MKSKVLIAQIEKVEKYIQASNEELEALYYFKIVISIAIGAIGANLLNQIFSKGEVTLIFALLICIICLLFLYFNLEVLYRSRTRNFPDSMLNGLKGELNYREAQSNLIRKKTIDDYIDKAIEALNANTCKIGYDSDPEICNEELQKGIEKVLSDLIYRVNYVLNTDKSNFTIGLFLKEVIRKSDSNITSKPDDTESKFFILRDDHNLRNTIPNQMQSSDSLVGLEFDYFNNIKYVLNHNQSRYYQLNSEDNSLTTFMHPVPYICESDTPSGVLFIIAEGTVKKEEDLDTVMLIFNRILSNWIDKYDTCLYEHNLASFNGHKEKVILSDDAKKIIEEAKNQAMKAREAGEQ